ncbi:MAG: NAD(P)H-dependent oxidoreductase [Synergistaceae bacterium]|nr:NAD(P)H-dependent oxidoreductase [Synergistaceae bacterium]
MSKKLVAYFSASGVTKAVAERLAEAAGADLYEIRPKVPYTSADLDWNDSTSRSSVEMRDKAFRPEIADKDAKAGDYDVIFLGFPVWWYVAPTIVNTFLEAYDLSGKTIILFATSGGSGFGKTVEGLKGSAPGAIIREGKLLNGRPSVAELKKWVDGFGA